LIQIKPFKPGNIHLGRAARVYRQNGDSP